MENNKFSSLYKKINSSTDLAQWLKYCLADDQDFFISQFDNNYVSGIMCGVDFRIDMPQRSKLILKVESIDFLSFDGFNNIKEHVTSRLKSAIAPVMWNATTPKNKNYTSSEILSYTYINKKNKDKYDVFVWDTKTPYKTLSEFAEWYLSGLSDIKIEEVYPSYNEKFRDILAHTKTNFIVDDKLKKQILGASEFELFIMIKLVSEKLKTFNVAFSTYAPKTPEEREYEAQLTMLSYLFSCTKNFGVEPYNYNFEGDYSEQQELWYEWWNDAYEALISKNPNILEEWKSYPKGFDPNFKPSCTLKDFSEIYKCLQQRELERNSAKRLAIVLNNLAAERQQEQLRKQTPTGRAQNLVDNVRKNVLSAIKKEEFFHNSPFEKF